MRISRVLRVWCPFLLILLDKSSVVGVDGGEIACHAIRYIFNNKNLDVSEVPVSPRQGKCNILVDFTYKY